MTTSVQILNETVADEDPGVTVLSFAEPAGPDEPTYREWFRSDALKSRWMTYFVAFYVHWLMLLGLGVVCLHRPETFEPLLLNAIFSDHDLSDESVFEIVEADFETDSAETTLDDRLTSVDTSSLVASTIVPALDMPAVSDAFATVAVQESSTDARPKSKLPNQRDSAVANVPHHAVTAGSFSVWTVPDNPAPGEPYRIVIQIRLPEGTEKYSVADLEGIIVGSDGYQKMIPGAFRGYLPIIDGRVKMEVHVVSADLRVEDTVFVKSKMLREAQRLKIRF